MLRGRAAVEAEEFIVEEVCEMALVGMMKRGGSKTVAEVAAESGVSPAWLVDVCRKERVPGVTGAASALSPDWSNWVQERACQMRSAGCGARERRNHADDIGRIQVAHGPARVDYTAITANRSGPQQHGTPDAADVERMIAKSRHLIDSGHYDCAIVTVFSVLKGIMEDHRPQDHSADVGLIESVFTADGDEPLRQDLHRIRVMANRAKHEQLVPSLYDAEKALWVYSWLMGPHGRFSCTDVA